MTKVQLRFELERPLDPAQMARLADAHSIYGILRLKPSATLDALLVEYDATRLQPAEVESALGRAGIAIRPAA